MEMKTVGVEKNQTFQYLKALLIIMVIDDHVSRIVGILLSWFPYNSFYMPMFVMISGYFYKKQPIVYNIKHKVKRLLLPYILWSLFGDLLAYVLYIIGDVEWYEPITLKSVVSLLVAQPLSSIVGAGWFVIMLFYVAICYNCLRVILKKDGLLLDSIILLISVLLGFVSTFICVRGYDKKLYYTVILRFLFYFQFFHMGVMFRRYWETVVSKWSRVSVCLICILCNVVFMYIFQQEINFYSTVDMSCFTSWYLPLVTSITGGLFWYEVAGFMASKIGEVRWISFIADHTFTIMMSHLIFVNIPNFYVYYKIRHGSTMFPGFDVEAFQASAWVRYSPSTRMIGFFCGVAGSLMVSYILLQMKKRLRMKKNYINQNNQK